LKKLIARKPEVYGRFAGFIGKLANWALSLPHLGGAFLCLKVDTPTHHTKAA
jgi:hypothetical protein